MPFDTDVAPFRAVVLPSGGADNHLVLLAALGGDAAVAAAYIATNGSTGARASSVVLNAGVLDEWQDYRGPTGYAPTIFSGTAKPAWDEVNKQVVPDGIDDWGETALDALFDISGAKAIVFIGAYDSDNYLVSINNNGTARFMTVYADTTWKLNISPAFQSIDSGVAADATRRVVIVSKDGGTNGRAVVPDQTQVSGVVGAGAASAGDNALTLWRANNAFGVFAAAPVSAILVLNFDPSGVQRGFIRNWAVTYLGAVPA